MSTSRWCATTTAGSTRRDEQQGPSRSTRSATRSSARSRPADSISVPLSARTRWRATCPGTPFEPDPDPLRRRGVRAARGVALTRRSRPGHARSPVGRPASHPYGLDPPVPERANPSRHVDALGAHPEARPARRLLCGRQPPQITGNVAERSTLLDPRSRGAPPRSTPAPASSGTGTPAPPSPSWSPGARRGSDGVNDGPCGRSRPAA